MCTACIPHLLKSLPTYSPIIGALSIAPEGSQMFTVAYAHSHCARCRYVHVTSGTGPYHSILASYGTPPGAAGAYTVYVSGVD